MYNIDSLDGEKKRHSVLKLNAIIYVQNAMDIFYSLERSNYISKYAQVDVTM